MLFFGMNPAQLEKLLRTLLQVAGTIATTFGWLTTGQVDGYTQIALQITGPLVQGLTAFWTLRSGTQTNLLLTAENSVPSVDKILLKPTPEGRELEAATPTAPKIMVNRS